MNRLFIAITLLLLIGVISCNEKEQPQVIYDDSKSDTLTIENVLDDTTKVLVVGMPVYLDSTDILIHPIGWDNIYTNSKKRFSSGYSDYIDSDSRLSKGKHTESNIGYSVNSNEKDYIVGEMVNLIFEDVETGKQRILTDKVMIINYVSYLKELAKKINRHYLLYTVYDKDYNRDGKLDYMDMPAYYMSNLDGTNFTKITQDYHYFDTSKLLYQNGKYYFRTIEDVNKDGEFNKKDQYHYYYIDLNSDNFTPTEYYPLRLMNIKQ